MKFTRIVPNQRTSNWQGVAVSINANARQRKALKLRVYIEADILKQVGLKEKDGCNCSVGRENNLIYVKIEKGDDFTITRHSRKGVGPAIPVFDGLPDYPCKLKQASYEWTDTYLTLKVPDLQPVHLRDRPLNKQQKGLTEEQIKYLKQGNADPKNNIKVKREPGL